jgi:hypothetical protein
MNAQERLDYLLETIPTNRQIIVADIIAAVGVDASGLVLGTLQAAAATNPVLAAAYQALITVGISLSDELRQGMIDQLALASQSQAENLRWSNELRDAVKALGRVPRWTTAGYDTEPTLSQITTEVRKQELEDAAIDRLQAFREALSSWDGIGEEPVL